ncbi:MAG: PIG-L family deacetylase [Treponema sp.]|jgi:LmbE family N-acetylglucosaminyl deacetylase|nr:PIG-L family deacetylase [Treponema sp.]
MDKINIMMIGAHPDDCDFRCGGTAIKYLRSGCRVMFLSMTNGCNGHHLDFGSALASRRREETGAAAKLLGIDYRVLDIPDGSLTAELRYRDMLMREIRAFMPDVIITHRSNDYHPDHRSAGTLVTDCSYLVMVPGITADSPPLKKAPFIFYMTDSFTFPAPFTPDAVVAVDDVLEEKTALLNCHASQVYEWLPWVEGYSQEVPPAGEGAKRLSWLKDRIKNMDAPGDTCRELLIKRYGRGKGAAVTCCESFQLCEYGARGDAKKITELFP